MRCDDCDVAMGCGVEKSRATHSSHETLNANGYGALH